MNMLALTVFELIQAPWIYIALLAFTSSMGLVAYLILLERKVASWAQDRVGPNRVGFGFGLPFLPKFHFWGLGQPLNDGLKFLLKEDYRPGGVDKVLFTIAPMVMILSVIISLAVIPWGGTKASVEIVDVTTQKIAGTSDDKLIADATANTNATKAWYSTILGAPAIDYVTPERTQVALPSTWPVPEQVGKSAVVRVITGWPFQVSSISIGILFVLSTLSLAVYGVVIGGWASNNKYSFLGGLRACANMISYEIPLGLSVLIVVLMFGTLDLAHLVESQARYWWLFNVVPIPAWNVFSQPMAFVLFLICIHAEANRAPFDLAEAEQELVGGYHTEYSSMRFALFFLSEYAGMITTSCVCVALFFGGWHLPGLNMVFNKLSGGHGAIGWNPGWSESIVLCLIRMGVFFAKAIVILFLFMWVRWSLPRFRFDQLMRLAWGGLIPISIGLLVATAVVTWMTGGKSYDNLDGWTALLYAAMNGAVLLIVVIVIYFRGPAASTNRRLFIPNSRFRNQPMTA